MLHEFTPVQLEQMGFNFVMSLLQLQNSYGEAQKRAVQGYNRHAAGQLAQALDELDQLVRLQQANPDGVADLLLILHRFKDIHGIVRLLAGGAGSLDETDLFALKNFAIDMESLCAAVQTLGVKLADRQPISLMAVVRLLNLDEQVTRTFFIDSRYSPKLAEIRQQKQALEQQLKHQPQDEALHQQRQQVVEQEQAEEASVRRILTQKLAGFVDALQADMAYIGQLDFTAARASLALSHNCTRPQFDDGAEIRVHNAINPQVQQILAAGGRQFTPISMTLQKGANVLTGANMGGKTVALSTITLNILLAHCGFYVFAEALSLPVLDYVFYLCHDAQSIHEGLSSFGAEIKQVGRLLQAMGSSIGFAALDEFARGTNPEEGALMMRALMHFAGERAGFCLASTHFSGVVQPGMAHFQVVGLKKVRLDDAALARTRHDTARLQDLMDFQIENVGWDAAIPRDALHIAELMDMQADFLALVKQFYKESE